MQIHIEYDSCWQTSFLGNDIKRPVAKANKQTNLYASQGYIQKFVATTKTKGEHPSPITKNTVMGILCRLVGDQQKLYKSRESKNYYFSDIEDHVSFAIENKNTEQELIYLTNKSDSRCAQSTYLGVLSSDNPWFFSDVARTFWSVLFLSKNDLLDFILKDEALFREIDSSPKNLMLRIDQLSNPKTEEGSVFVTKNKLLSDKIREIEKKKNQLESVLKKAKLKPPKSKAQLTRHQSRVEKIEEEIDDLKHDYQHIDADSDINNRDDKLKSVVDYLSMKFHGNEYLSNEVVYPVRFYAAALYLQAEHLNKVKNDLDFMKDKNGEISIQGFSKRAFNGKRDWLNPMTGKRKKAVGSPCYIQKQSGCLKITIDIDREKAKELKRLIENAGVSSFYLGKKGLAYVTDIDTREVRR